MYSEDGQMEFALSMDLEALEQSVIGKNFGKKLIKLLEENYVKETQDEPKGESSVV